MYKSFLILTSAALLLSCNGPEKEPDGPKPLAPNAMTYSIVASFPHDTSSYTQGLTFYKDEMYEGTGNWGESKLKKVDLITGKPLKQIALDKTYFGEGVTILNDTIYQLTYKEKKVFVYTLKDFR
ncbi:MAG: glutaminyl-peptide cyclotransferase [Chitinophagaceae bacterium]|nr:glutaminyl-peptide cyclotransferase [Chitinophagaceae bacterium]